EVRCFVESKDQRCDVINHALAPARVSLQTSSGSFRLTTPEAASPYAELTLVAILDHSSSAAANLRPALRIAAPSSGDARINSIAWANSVGSLLTTYPAPALCTSP